MVTGLNHSHGSFMFKLNQRSMVLVEAWYPIVIGHLSTIQMLTTSLCIVWTRHRGE